MQVLFHISGISCYNTGHPSGAAQYVHTVDRSILLLAPRLLRLFFLFLSCYHLFVVYSFLFLNISYSTIVFYHDLCPGHGVHGNPSQPQRRIEAWINTCCAQEQVYMRARILWEQFLKEVLHRIPYLFLLEDPILLVQFHQISALYHLSLPFQESPT